MRHAYWNEFQALRDVKVGKPINPEMQARLTKLKLAAQMLGGFSLTTQRPDSRLTHLVRFSLGKLL
jgi:hypothetical protein